MGAERGISVDHTTSHRWTVHYAPLLLEQFNRRKRPVTGRQHFDEIYIKVRGQWRYLYHAIHSNVSTIELWFSDRRNPVAARQFLNRVLKQHGRPERIAIDASQTNPEAFLSCNKRERLQDRTGRQPKPIRIRQSQHLSNCIEQDHRAMKPVITSMLGFQSVVTARVIRRGIELILTMRKQQAKYARNPQPSLVPPSERWH
jgi:putative transposase